MIISCEIPQHLYAIKHTTNVYMTRLGGYHNHYEVILNEELQLWLASKGDYTIVQTSRPNPLTERYERTAKIVFENEDTAMEFKLIWL